MLVLGIETTCDETGAALVERNDDGGGTILSNVVLSQIADHEIFGGVVPEIAARAHVEVLDTVIATAMNEGGCGFADIDGVAAAAGPGLIGGVIVGLTTAKSIAIVHEKPLIAVNHLEAHALTARLTDATPFPFLLFLASGGHTQIVAALGIGDYVRLGTTRDDAIGEAFDKTAKLLGLGYPGGPRVEAEAIGGDRGRFDLPRPMIGRHDADFSLSGLKTAVRLEAEKIAPLSDADVSDLCASFQLAVVEMIIDRLREGVRIFRQRFGAPSALVAAGGVVANQAVRDAILDVALQNQMPLVVPPPNLCTDNAAMIAWAGIERLSYGLCDPLDVAPRARWPLSEVSKPAPNAKRVTSLRPRRAAAAQPSAPSQPEADRLSETPPAAPETAAPLDGETPPHQSAETMVPAPAGLDTLLEGAVMVALETTEEQGSWAESSDRDAPAADAIGLWGAAFEEPQADADSPHGSDTAPDAAPVDEVPSDHEARFEVEPHQADHPEISSHEIETPQSAPDDQPHSGHGKPAPGETEPEIPSTPPPHA